MPSGTLSQRAAVLAPRGRDAAVACAMLAEAGIAADAAPGLAAFADAIAGGVGFAVVTEEALATADLSGLGRWIARQEEWSDLPFIVLTTRGGGLERNPLAARLQQVLGNATFLERPFHPTSLVSLARSALRARRRQYEARARLVELRDLAASLETRVAQAAAERTAALAQLHEAQKLETIGHLTGGVAHDFNNLLTPIVGALDLLHRRHGATDPRSARLLAGAIESAERARTLVQRLLGFARRQALETRPVDLAALVGGMRGLILASVGAAVECRVEAEHGMPAAMVDPNQLELAILNLCVNARDAMPAGGTLVIALAADTLHEAAWGAPAGRHVRCSVTDTGVGMDAQTLARAVEPFYSTKEVGRGTGLGLSMVHGLARQLGGGFRLTSRVGEGTRVDLWLPAAAGTAAPPRPPAGGAADACRPLAVLLVDDEPLVRAATAEMLRDAGHRVTEAASAADALARLDEVAPDIVVTDYKMPRMDGAAFAGRVRERRTDLPVLLITGYTGASAIHPSLPRLDKPFGRADLIRAVERAVAADPGAGGRR